MPVLYSSTVGADPGDPSKVYRIGSVVDLKAVNTSKSASSAISIEILRHITVLTYRRSQVVLAKLVNGHLTAANSDKSVLRNGSNLVAKFFDPSYAIAESVWEGGSVESCARVRNNELAAYTRLQQLQGTNVPLFFGEYTSKIRRHSESEGTHVGVLLFEFVSDPILSDYFPDNFTSADSASLKLAAFSVLDRVHKNGVYHHDIARRNMFWNCESKEFKLFDFEFATFDNGSFADKIREWEDSDISMMYSELREFGIVDDRNT